MISWHARRRPRLTCTDEVFGKCRVERTRIARELHDSVSQDLFSLSLLAGGMRRALPADSALLRQAEAMERTVDHTMREMRAMLLELRPVALEDAGLVAALQELCRAYEARLGIQISADVGDLQVEPAVELAVLRVAQEALGNAARHGGAQDIELSVAEVEGHVVMAISDRGRGFDPVRAGARHGMGLALMRERVTELGGTFDLASAPGSGTTVRVRIPGGAS
ncbi:sensor histidine kinase [Actinomadura monticuli]|uniref:Oxygen sensor histidine kinase NreB n=1 Tax=Actinomadura monticuli TaxID=3097367 RepID=A0ABV4Q738_9ACTN